MNSVSGSPESVGVKQGGWTIPCGGHLGLLRVSGQTEGMEQWLDHQVHCQLAFCVNGFRSHPGEVITAPSPLCVPL